MLRNHDDQSSGANNPATRTETPAEARFRAAVEEAEAKVTAAKEKADKPGGPLEPLWMTLFQAFVLFGMGGIHGIFQAADERLLRFGRPPDSFGQLLLYDARSIPFGFAEHVSRAWPLDLVLLLSVALPAFMVKQTRSRRRYFRVAVGLTMAVFVLLIGVALKEMMAERGAL
jgi:hypothetical protein